MTEELQKLKDWVAAAENIVFFGGAGVSTESGIPDFRSTDGIYALKYKYPPETMVSIGFLTEHPAEFFDFYRDKLLYPDAEPNAAHRILARWEQEGRLSAVVTQNIDGLHQAAGSRNVLELHGSTLRTYCARCGRRFGPEAIPKDGSGVPRCECGGVIRPDVVLYGEGLDSAVINAAVRAIEKCDVLIVAGTSLSVWLAAGLIDYYRGDRMVLINRTATARDGAADLIVRGSLGETLAAAADGLPPKRSPSTNQ